MTIKTAFFEGWSWFKFNNFGLALGTNLKFYTSVAKGLKLKVRNFLGLNRTFVEVTGEKLVRGGLFAHHPSSIGLTVTWYTFNFQLYQQTDGVAMGGLASSTTTEIYMQAYERTAITTALHPPKVWERFVNDAYSILQRTHLEKFSIISTIFIKILSLLCWKKVMET